MGFDLDTRLLDLEVEELYPQLEADLLSLLACPSVEGEAEPGAPFGSGVAAALSRALAICTDLGLDAHDLDGYCGYADYAGRLAAQVGVLAHLDVVPARAEEWSYPPFDPQVVDGYIYGRGTLDDKGPLLAALYGFKALIELGFEPRRSLRFIMGCNEETGMACMQHYLQKMDPPVCGFTPDAQWPLIIGEKGVCHYVLGRRWQQEEVSGARLLSIQAGVAPNVVPARAEALLTGLPSDIELPEGVSREELADGRTLLSAVGRAAHGSTPQEGVNALSLLLQALASLHFGPAPAWEFVQAAAALTKDDCFGSSMGLDGTDARSRVTHAPTMCHLDENGAELTCDLRFLLTKSSADYLPKLEAAARAHGLTLLSADCQEPLWLGEDHPLITDLLESYREVTGDMTPPLVIGGGTYAKLFPNFLAFGPEPHDRPTLAHQANERISREELKQAVRIYARALYRLCV